MKKKIAFITSSPTIVNSFLKNHIKELSKIYDITILLNLKAEKEQSTLSYSINKKTYEDLYDYATLVHFEITRRISFINDVKTIFKLWRFFKKEKFSSVHSITSKAGILVMISGYFAKINFRFHTYTGQVWANMTGTKRDFFKFMDKSIATLATKVYADSESQMEYLILENVVKKNKINVLGKGSISGVDISRFSENTEKRIKIREEYSIPDDELVFLLLCRLTIDKGVLDLAHAFSRLVKEYKCSLLIVGPDEENLIGEIKSIVGEYSNSNLFFHDYTFTHEDFLNAADILCLPSYREGFGSIIIDAASVGIPSIGSNIYGISDAIVDGETGILHKVGDINDLYLSMRKLARNKELRSDMGKAAQKRVIANYTMDMITKAWVEEYVKTID